jgi:ribosome maturation factor RimP
VLVEALVEKPSLLIDLRLQMLLKLLLDDDNGVALQDCIDVSRAIDLI